MKVDQAYPDVPVVETLDQVVVSVTTGYHTEHESDDRHKTIHATGSISERARTVAIGDWAPLPVALLTFSASGAMTWTVPLPGVIVRVMRIGSTIVLNLTIPATTVGGVLGNELRVLLPDDTYRAAVTMRSPSIRLDDNGVIAQGFAFIFAGERLLRFNRLDQAVLTAAAGTTAIYGTFSYEAG